MDDDVIDLLNRVKCCVDDCEIRVSLGLIPHGSSKARIFKGSYDVLETAADGAIYDKIMNDKLNKVRDLGLIVNESGQNEWRENENWSLTALGQAGECKPPHLPLSCSCTKWSVACSS